MLSLRVSSSVGGLSLAGRSLFAEGRRSLSGKYSSLDPLAGRDRQPVKNVNKGSRVQCVLFDYDVLASAHLSPKPAAKPSAPAPAPTAPAPAPAGPAKPKDADSIRQKYAAKLKSARNGMSYKKTSETDGSMFGKVSDKDRDAQFGMHHGASSLLTFLRGRGLAVGLVLGSGVTDMDAQQFIEESKTDYVAVVRALGDEATPSKASIEAAAAKLGIAPSATMVVSEKEAVIAAARDATATGKQCFLSFLTHQRFQPVRDDKPFLLCRLPLHGPQCAPAEARARLFRP